MSHLRIKMSDITLGKPLPWDVYDSSNKLLLRKGHIVQREEQIEALFVRGLFVVSGPDKCDGKKTDDAPLQPVERPSALHLINMANKQLEELQLNLHAQSDAYPKILELVKLVEQAVNINSNVALACILLNQDSVSYVMRHCVDTAVVTMLVARAVQATSEEIQAMMAAALMMNVGMLQHQKELESHQRGSALSERQLEAIRKHPQESVKLLRQAGVNDEQMLDYILLHHENEDGSGYPFGKTGDDIPRNAKIIALADRYCARISERNYRKSMLPNGALRDILLAEKKNIEPTLVASLIRNLGTYPTGTYVRLVNGEIGVVTGPGNTTTTPVVHALIGPRGAPLMLPIRRETHKELFAIKEVLCKEQATVGFRMQQLWGDDAQV